LPNKSLLYLPSWVDTITAKVKEFFVCESLSPEPAQQAEWGGRAFKLPLKQKDNINKNLLYLTCGLDTITAQAIESCVCGRAFELPLKYKACPVFVIMRRA